MPELRPSRDNIIAVMVTYHSDASVVQRLRAIAGQFGRAVVVDNGSRKAAFDSLRCLASEDARVGLIENAENLGIAAARNLGCRRAFAVGSAWVATFDLDSVPAPDLVTRVAADWAADPRTPILSRSRSARLAGAREVHWPSWQTPGRRSSWR